MFTIDEKKKLELYSLFRPSLFHSQILTSVNSEGTENIVLNEGKYYVDENPCNNNRNQESNIILCFRNGKPHTIRNILSHLPCVPEQQSL